MIFFNFSENSCSSNLTKPHLEVQKDQLTLKMPASHFSLSGSLLSTFFSLVVVSSFLVSVTALYWLELLVFLGPFLSSLQLVWSHLAF